MYDRIAKSSLPIQAKLTIGPQGDKYEREADRVAAEVVQRMQSPQASWVQPQSPMDNDNAVQMQPMVVPQPVSGGNLVSAELEAEINGVRGQGRSLEAGLQISMGQAMGANFSGVRVHTDARSDQLNRSIQSRAFTTGRDVFFRQGEYQPRSRGGQALIAHELAHVVQQSGEGVIQRTTNNKEDLVDRTPKKSKDVGRRSEYKTNRFSKIQRALDSNVVDKIKDNADADKWKTLMNVDILPKLTKHVTKKSSNSPNKRYFYKLIEDISKAINAENDSETRSMLTVLIKLNNLIEEEHAQVGGTEQWHPTGGKEPELEAALDQGGIYLHFTDQAGLQAIQRAGKIEDHSAKNRPGSKPGIYVAPGHQTFNPEEAHLNLFLGDEKYSRRGEYVIAVRLPTASVTEGEALTEKSKYKEAKYTAGDIDLQSAIYKGPNPFITGLD